MELVSSSIFYFGLWCCLSLGGVLKPEATEPDRGEQADGTDAPTKPVEGAVEDVHQLQRPIKTRRRCKQIWM